MPRALKARNFIFGIVMLQPTKEFKFLFLLFVNIFSQGRKTTLRLNEVNDRVY